MQGFLFFSIAQFDQIEDFFAQDGSRKLMFFYQECNVSAWPLVVKNLSSLKTVLTKSRAFNNILKD